MKNSIAAFLISAAVLVGVPDLAAAQLSIQSEEAAHPNLVKAIHEMQAALHALERAPDNFGGNKVAGNNRLTRRDSFNAQGSLLPLEFGRRCHRSNAVNQLGWRACRHSFNEGQIALEGPPEDAGFPRRSHLNSVRPARLVRCAQPVRSGSSAG